MILVQWALPAQVDDDVVRALDELLDASERARAHALANAADRRAFTVAHALARLAAPGAATSLTHVRTCVACASSGSGPVGVDVEQIGRIAVDEHVMRTACTPREIAALEACEPGVERDRLFARFWTRKEACYKAGLAAVMPDFNRFDTLGEPAATYGLSVTTFSATPDHELSVARAQTEDVELRQVDGRTLWRALQNARAAR